MKRRNQRRRATAAQRYGCASQAMTVASISLAVEIAFGELSDSARTKMVARLHATERHMWAAQKRALRSLHDV